MQASLGRAARPVASQPRQAHNVPGPSRCRRRTAPAVRSAAETREANAGAQPTTPQPTPRFDLAERLEFLREDLGHLFDDQGIDESAYDDVVTFLDPITKYSNVQGYMFNIRMLKSVFAPVFELHDIRPTGRAEITTRWTMTMAFTPAKALGLSRWWSPVITFTGTSAYGFNPANGRINRHVDTWDSISNQAYFSLEAFGDFFRQLLATYTTPPLESPTYTLLRRAARFEVRRYNPFAVASTALDNLPPAAAPASSSGSGSSGDGDGATAAAAGAVSSSSSTGSSSSSSTGSGPSSGGSSSSSSSGSSSSGGAALRVNPASAGMRAFNALAGYIFGKNAQQRKMAMTTPVFSSTDGTMAFVVAAQPGQASASSLPAPLDPAVKLRAAPGGMYAAAKFSGVATPRRCAEVHAQLEADLAAAGLRPAEAGAWTLARYNDPSVKPRFRRNEVLVQLADFDLWA